MLLAVVAHGAQPQDEGRAFLQVEDNPMEKVPVVGSQFKVNPVSTSMQCVVSLTIQYFVVYTALALARTAAKSFGIDYGKTPIISILVTATYTVSFAPMLAVLFLGCRMRVTWLTQGKGNPPEYVQVAMYCATYAVLAMTLCVCVIPIFTGKVFKVDPKTGDIPKDAKPFAQPIVAGCFAALKFLIMLGLYAGALVVVYGIINFEPPKGTWPGDVIPPVSPAVQCVMILSCQYFAVYGAIQVCKSIEDWLSFSNPFLNLLQESCQTATLSMNFAPMLAILFIGARMRALQMDPVNGAPQKWAQNCFFMCTYAVLAQTCLCIAIPVVIGGKAKPGKVEGDMEYDTKGFLPGIVMTVIRFCITICIYVGFTCVIYSILTIQHPQGPQYTPPISVTMQCVINLTIQFFTVYLGLWIAQTVKDFFGYPLPRLTQLMQDAQATVAFCPMLAILFVGTRMRALMITDNRGSPQGWVQDGMYMATWSLLIQFVMVLVTPCATGVPAQVDEDGNIKWEPDNKILFYCVVTIRALGFILLYGGTITVMTGLYTMTPETANGRGAVPLVGDGKVPGVGAQVPGYEGIKEPYGVNDVPGTPIEQKF